MLIVYDLTNVLQEFFFHIAFHYFWMKVNLRHSYFSQCYPQSFDGWSWSYSLLLFHFNSSWSRNQKRWSISIEGDNFSTITHSCNYNYQYVNAISAYGEELRKGTVRSPLSLSSLNHWFDSVSFQYILVAANEELVLLKLWQSDVGSLE